MPSTGLLEDGILHYPQKIKVIHIPWINNLLKSIYSIVN